MTTKPQTALSKTDDLRASCAEVVQPGESDKIAASLNDNELLDHLKTHLGGIHRTLQENLPYLRVARERFSAPGRRLPVPGNPTWSKWIVDNLHCHPSTVRRWLAPPKVKPLPIEKEETQLRPVAPLEDWPEAMREANDFVAAVKRLLARTPINGSDMLIPALRELAAIAGCQLVEPLKPAPEPKLPTTVIPGENRPAIEDGKSRPSKPDPNTNRVAADKGWGTDARNKSFFQGKDE